MAGAYGTCRGDAKYTQCFGGENVKERGHLKDIGLDGIWMELKQTGWESVECFRIGRSGWLLCTRQ
jgi:hypothetical protein